MATYIKDLKEDNGDITRPVTEAGAVLLSGGGDLETTLASKADQTDVNGKIDIGDVQSTDIVANAVTTAKIADGAVTTAKIDDEAVTSAKMADDAVTNAKIDFSTFTATDLTSSITNIAAHSGGTNNFNLKVMGNLAILEFFSWWVNSVTANSASVVGKLPSSVLPTDGRTYISGFCSPINGDSGALLGHGRADIEVSSGNVRCYSSTGRSGLTAWRGKIVWFIK